MYELKRVAPLIVLVACTPEIDEESVGAVVNEALPCVATVSWSTHTATRGRVEYGPDTSYGYTTPFSGDAAADHAIDVIGLPPGSEWHYRVVAATEKKEFVGEDHTVSTPASALSLPDYELLESDGGEWGEWTLAAYLFSEPGSGAVVLDSEGKVVWYWSTELGVVPTVQLTPDGRTVMLRIDLQDALAEAQVVLVSLDGRSIEYIPTPFGHHALAKMDVPGVRFAFIRAVVEQVDGENVVGDSIVEVADDGTERIVWNSFDQLEIVRHGNWDVGFYNEGADWTHANGLHYDPADDAFYLSLYYLNAVVKVDRASGDTLWQLGGERSDFTFADDAGFSHQHAPEVADGNLYVFDNSEVGHSRGVGYELDEDAWTARPIWQWSTPEQDHATVLGDVDILPDDQLLTAWGEVGQINIVGRDGTVHRRMDGEPGVITGKAHRFESFYE